MRPGSGKPGSKRSEGGFSFVELLMVLAIMLPVLAVVASSTDVATKTLRANEINADVIESLQRTTQRIVQFIRPAVLSTYRVEATAADVTAGRATNVGEWIDPLDLEPRTVVRFRAAEGILSMNAAALSRMRTLRFRLDDNEIDNDLDDDDDGLIDEGGVYLTYEGAVVQLASEIEECVFILDGRLLRMRIRAGERRQDGSIYRATTTQSLILRNN